ncbi:MAG: hypothetical protein JWO06_33 [Bacteroidota bacterium]|nr:hypothetical protein [Bacteroidota bacterium]
MIYNWIVYFGQVVINYIYYCMYCLISLVKRQRPVEHMVTTSLFSSTLLLVAMLSLAYSGLWQLVFGRFTIQGGILLMAFCYLGSWCYLNHNQRKEKIIAHFQNQRGSLHKKDALIGFMIVFLSFISFVAATYIMDKNKARTNAPKKTELRLKHIKLSESRIMLIA